MRVCCFATEEVSWGDITTKLRAGIFFIVNLAIIPNDLFSRIQWFDMLIFELG